MAAIVLIGNQLDIQQIQTNGCIFAHSQKHNLNQSVTLAVVACIK